MPESATESAKKTAIVAQLWTPDVVRAFLAVLAIALGVLLVFHLQEVLILLLLALFLSAAMDRSVEMLRRWGIPRGVGILLHYAVVVGLLVFFALSFIPIIAEQLTDIADTVRGAIDHFLADPVVRLPFVPESVNAQLTSLATASLHSFAIEGWADALAQFRGHAAEFAQGSARALATVAGSAARTVRDVIIVLVLAFFIQMDKTGVFQWVRHFFPRESRAYVDEKSALIQEKLSQWIRGQMLLCLCIGSLTFVVLLILRVPYALTLALLAGAMEAVPYMGPLIAAIPSVLIAAAHGGADWAMIVAAAYYGIQFTENNIVVPLIMKHAVDLSAVAILVGMLLGVSFPSVIHPVLGIFLSIPCVAIVSIFLEDLRRKG